MSETINLLMNCPVCQNFCDNITPDKKVQVCGDGGKSHFFYFDPGAVTIIKFYTPSKIEGNILPECVIAFEQHSSLNLGDKQWRVRILGENVIAAGAIRQTPEEAYQILLKYKKLIIFS